LGFSVSKTEGRTKADALKEMDLSLQALGADYTDAYLLHARDTAAGVADERVEALDTVKKQGRTRDASIKKLQDAGIGVAAMKSVGDERPRHDRVLHPGRTSGVCLGNSGT
jgi:aryl-alcohol dehydrogenase-like predicted oxidoreductase